MRPLFLAVLTCLPLLAAQPPGDGWKPLFDGRTSAGWRGMMGDPFPSDCWAVEDGMLHTKKCRAPRDIVTQEEFGDFEVVWDWRIPERGNTGLKYLVREGVVHPWQNDQRRPYAWAAGAMLIATLYLLRRSFVLAGICLIALTLCLFLYREYTWQGLRASASPEYQMLDDAHNHDALNGISYQTASLYALREAHDRTVLPAGEWNTSKVVVRGSHVEHWLNGTKVLDFDLSNPELIQAFFESKYHYIDGFLQPGRGRIALQHHGDEVWFRNLKIRTL